MFELLTIETEDIPALPPEHVRGRPFFDHHDHESAQAAEGRPSELDPIGTATDAGNLKP